MAGLPFVEYGNEVLDEGVYEAGEDSGVPGMFGATTVYVPRRRCVIGLSDEIERVGRLISTKGCFAVGHTQRCKGAAALETLCEGLVGSCCIISLSFRAFKDTRFRARDEFTGSFTSSVLRRLREECERLPGGVRRSLSGLEEGVDRHPLGRGFALHSLFKCLNSLYTSTSGPVMVVVSRMSDTSGGRIFLSFLTRLQTRCVSESVRPTFRSIVLTKICSVGGLGEGLQPRRSRGCGDP